MALRESEHKNFSIEDLTCDSIKTDGQKIYDAILSSLIRANVSPDVKKDKILNQFSLIKDTQILNTINAKLGKTPLRHYTEFLNEKIYKSIKYTKSSEDYLGRFYGEFMSYSGGDGQSLGIVLTPKHITDLFCDLVDIKDNDIVLDPTCGTAGFLVASMYHMLEKLEEERINHYGMSDNEYKQKQANIRQKQLHGFELQPYMFTIATTNMILRGDGKSNLINGDFLAENASKLQLKQSTVGMINPPYSQGSKNNPDLYEINFISHLLDSLATGGRCIAIVPQSSMTGKTKEEVSIKENILKKHTLEGVITLNKDTFYGVGTMPCVAIFTAGIPHSEDKECKFIDFKNDGFKVAPNIGLIETEQAKDRKQHLLAVWFNKIEAETKFCVKTTVQAEDEWLHSFYYFNDEIPTEEDFEKTIGDYLTFEFSMIMNNKEYLFTMKKEYSKIKSEHIESLEKKQWREFIIEEIFNVLNSKPYHKKDLKISSNSNNSIPYVSRTNRNNGVEEIIQKEEDFKINKKNTIAFGAENATFFLQPFDYITGNKIYTIYNKNINKFNGLFIQQTLNTSIKDCGFSYGQGLTGTRAKRRNVLLPVNENNEPDFAYMEQYIKNIMYKKINQYLNYLGK